MRHMRCSTSCHCVSPVTFDCHLSFSKEQLMGVINGPLRSNLGHPMISIQFFQTTSCIPELSCMAVAERVN